MSLITQKKEKKITYKEQVISLDMETVKEINNYCRIAGITKGKAEEISCPKRNKSQGNTG